MPQVLDEIFAEKEEETEEFRFSFVSSPQVQVLTMTETLSKTDSELLDSIFADEE